MTIDLMKLAKESHFVEIECSFGIIKVYHVPEQFFWGMGLGYERPKQPRIEMKTATGQVQVRLSKIGDESHERWLEAVEKYDTELEAVQLASRYVYALKDVAYPSDLSVPPPNTSDFNESYPEKEILRKHFWLKATAFRRTSDFVKIQNAMQELNGSLELAVDATKKNSISE